MSSRCLVSQAKYYKASGYTEKIIGMNLDRPRKKKDSGICKCNSLMAVANFALFKAAEFPMFALFAAPSVSMASKISSPSFISQGKTWVVESASFYLKESRNYSLSLGGFKGQKKLVAPNPARPPANPGELFRDFLSYDLIIPISLENI